MDECFARNDLDANDKCGVRQIHRPAACVLHTTPDDAFELGRRHGKRLVGSTHGHSKVRNTVGRQMLDDRRRNGFDVRRDAASKSKVGKPECSTETIAHLGPLGLLSEHDLDSTHRHANRADVQIGKQRTQVAEQPMNEPGTVLSLERDFLVMRDDGKHMDDSVQGLPYRPDPTISSAAFAARCPETTALSIVAGSPVAIQSPARKKPATGVCVSGRAGLPGRNENVARRSDRKSTRLNSSHGYISYAVFCLKKKKKKNKH